MSIDVTSRRVPSPPDLGAARPLADAIADGLPGAHHIVRGRGGSGRSTLLDVLAAVLPERGLRVARAAATGQIIWDADTVDHGPVVVLADDVHSLDDLPAMTLARGVDARRAWLVATCASGHDLPQPLRHLTPAPRRHVLPEMSMLHADQMIEEALGGWPSPGRRRRLLRLADGRTGVLTELLDDLTDADGVPYEDIAVGARVRRRVERELTGLQPDERRLVERIALAVALPVATLPEDLIDVADALARRGLLDADGAARLRVSDPLVRDVLLRDMAGATKVLHGQWLAARAQEDEGGHVPPWVSVPWRLLAGHTVAEEDLLQAALASPDPSMGEQLASSVVGATGGRAAELVLSRVALILGREDAAVPPLEDASSEFEPEGTRAVPPLVAARAYAAGRRGDRGMVQALVAAPDAEEADQQLARLVQLIVMGDLEEGLAHGEQLRITAGYARRAALVMAWGRLLQARPADVRDLLADEWSAADNPVEATGSTALRAHALLLEDVIALDAALRAWRADSTQARTVRWWLAAEVAAAAGEHAAALALLRAADAEGREVDYFGTLHVARWLGRRIALEAGLPPDDVGLGPAETAEVPWGAPHATPAAMAEVWQAARDGEDPCEVACARIATTGEAVMPAVLIAHSALRVGVPGRRVASMLTAQMRAAPARGLQVMVRHIDAAASGATSQLVSVAEDYADIGQTLLAAEARAQAGLASLHRDLPPTPLLEMGPSPLTPREHALVQMVLEGDSNAEIAAALTLSVRTVESHLSAAYQKLGVAGRSGLRAL